jgi:hypothetical protein
LAGDVGDTGSLDIQRSSFYKNHAIDGGAVNYSGVRGATPEATSLITDSTFVENTASRGGGALNGSFSYLTATNSTFVDNSADYDGHTSWSTSIRRSLIALTSSLPAGDVACMFGGSHIRDGNISTVVSCLDTGESAVSLSSLDLSFFAPWGGDTPTVKIGSASSARNVIGSTSCTSTDQRGTSRSGATCDAGAFEYVDGLPNLSTSTVITLLEGRALDTTPVFTSAGLVSPIQYRVAAELVSLPIGVTMSTIGRVSGTPGTTTSELGIVITATDANGAITSAQLEVDNCLLSTQSGRFLIATASDLDFFRMHACGLDADFTQTADISWDDVWDDLSTSSDPFTGTYDGGGFSISGLQMEGDESAFVARTDGASITDVFLEVTVSGDYGSAGVVHYANSTTIEDVHVSGSITTPVAETDRGCLGGLAGETDLGTVIRRSSFEGTVIDASGSWIGGLVGCGYTDTVIESSYFSGDVEGDGNVGGLVGWMDQTDIRDSYAVGTVTGSGTEIGGLVGWQSGDSTDADSISITNSYASTAVSGGTSVGALIGIGDATTISDSFWEGGLSGASEPNPFGAFQSAGSQPAITALTAEEMKTFSSFNDAGWLIVNGWASAVTSPKKWGICNGIGRPYLLWEHASAPCAPTGTTASTSSESAMTPSPRGATPIPESRTLIVGQPVGGAEVMVNGQRLSASLTWASDNTIRGTIGGVNLALRFEEGLTSPDLRPVIVRGRSFRLSLRGLQPESDLSATIFSRPTRLGTFQVSSDGSIRKVVDVPSDRALGLHRLRIKMVDQAGREITLWLGIHVRGAKALKSAGVK